MKLRLQGSQPQQHLVRVGLDSPVDYRPAPDGRIQFSIPRLSDGCDVYVFGLIKIRDGSADAVRVVELRRDERIVRRLSLTQISKLPKDEAGFSIVRIEN